MRVKAKVAIVTGSGSGIGRATAILLAKEGAKVVVADINLDGANETVSQIHEADGQAVSLEADVSKETDAQKIAATAVKTYGTINILVNNAAVFVFNQVEDVTEADWDRVLAVNIKGAAFCSKAVIPTMKKIGGGAIVNLGSISSVVAQPAFVPYNTTKAALLNFTRCLAMDLGPSNIRVNIVCPGGIMTPAFEDSAETANLTLEQACNDLSDMTFLGRVGKPIEIAQAILFLASDDASYITATPLFVDGGYIAH